MIKAWIEEQKVQDENDGKDISSDSTEIEHDLSDLRGRGVRAGERMECLHFDGYKARLHVEYERQQTHETQPTSQVTTDTSAIV